jgi:glutathione synthase/RimK-type ligase-like ATP-grasp enzyme
MCPLVFYDKSPPLGKDMRSKFIEELIARGVLFVTNPRFRQLFADKWEQHRIFTEHKIPTPCTELLTRESAIAFMKRYRTVFVKPRVGSGGNDQTVIVRLEQGFLVRRSSSKSPSLVLSLEDVLEYLPEQMDDYIIQEGISVDRLDGRVYDFRVVCQRGKSGRFAMTGCYMRIGPPHSHQANIKKRGHPQDPALVFEEWPRIERELRVLSKKIFDAFGKGLGEAGIDVVMTTSGRLLAIELNTRPGSKGFELMRAWVTDDKHHRKNLVLPYPYTNTTRRAWGRRLKLFKERPILFAEHLYRHHTE